MRTLPRAALFVISVSLLAGCKTTALNEGTGYSLLTPAPASASFIVKNDKTFAQQVAAHNRQCRKDAGCQK